MKLIRNTIKSKFTYNGRGIAFDGEGSWSFGNDFARNVALSGVFNTSSTHRDNRKSLLDEGPTQGINDSSGAAEKNKNFSFNKASTKFFSSLNYHGDESYLYVNKT